MSQLRAAINFSSKKKDLLQHEKQFINLTSKSIESSSSTSQSIDGESDDITVIRELNVQDSENSLDTDEGRNNNILTTEHWERELLEWEEMLIEEEVARFEEEEVLRDSLGSLEGDILSDYRHPAVD